MHAKKLTATPANTDKVKIIVEKWTPDLGKKMDTGQWKLTLGSEKLTLGLKINTGLKN